MYMCKVLMSIKLKYATQILNGTKTVEYRKKDLEDKMLRL